MKKIIAITLCIFMLLLSACGKNPGNAGNRPAENGAGASGPFVPSDIKDAVSELKTVNDWVRVNNRTDGYSVSTQGYDGLSRISLGETDYSAVIVVSIPGNEVTVSDEDGLSNYASDGYFDVLPENILKLPVERIEFLHFDWLGLTLPRGGKIGDTIDDIKADFLNTGSSYDSDLLYDISAVYPQAAPAEGDYGADANGYRMIVGGYQIHETSSDPSISDLNKLEYLWVSSPVQEDWKEYYKLEYFFDGSDKLYECNFIYWTDAE